MSTIQIQIVTWNSRQYLPRLFAAIRRQAVDYDLVIIDNASSDGTSEMIKNDFSFVSTPQNAGEKPLVSGITAYKGSLPTVETAKKVTLIVNRENRGFAAGHNQGFGVCRAPFVLVLNPDVELSEGFLEKCLSVIQSDTRIGAVAGKLYRRLPTLTPARNASHCEAGGPPSLPRGVYPEHQRRTRDRLLKGRGIPGIIDGCGLAMKPWGQIINMGEGQPDRGQFDNLSTVFGVSGAAAFYRLSALKSVADEYGVFDERFGSYKEDVDLAWRLARAGWKTVFVPGAVALHPRAVRHDNRDSRDDIINQLSLRNHLLTLKKNLSWRDWRRIPLITGYELAKFAYVLLFERQNLIAYENFKVQNPNVKSMPND